MRMTTPQASNKRVRPASNTPPTVNKKNKDSPPQPCSICESTIVESDELNEGEDAIFCEGECQIWLHRKCVGLTKNAFTSISNSNEPYLCPYCSNNYYKKEIKELNELVKTLSDRLSSIERQTIPPDATHSTELASNEVINQLLPNQPSQSSESLNSTRNRTATPLTGKPPASLPDNSVDRKFNLVIYGVKEHPKGTDRRARSKSDIDNCVRILKQADNDINIQSACKRLCTLGKV